MTAHLSNASSSKSISRSRESAEASARRIAQENERKKRNQAKKARKAARAAELQDRLERLNYPASGAAYVARYTQARTLGRRFIFHAGPTNAGKTHAAMAALMEAESGVYAAPLRLLALENFDAMEAAGLETALRTGEERLGVEDPTHLACTVEMVPTTGYWDIGVIDEIQMLGDPDRGSSWTRAVLGLAAREIHLAGGAEALPLIETLLALTGESLEVRTYERKTPLHILDEPVITPQKGDAIIAFSRRAVLRIRNELAAQGIRAAVIYGALGPEVRRAEAARFRTGQAPVLVATDAIGMGLNLPIQRVLFAEAEKYNGSFHEPLSSSLICQIGGRAGRYGLHVEGHVGTYEWNGLHPRADIPDCDMLKEAFDQGPEMDEARPAISPTAEDLAAFTPASPDSLGYDSFCKHWNQSETFQARTQADTRAILALCARVGDIPIQDAAALMGAPVRGPELPPSLVSFIQGRMQREFARPLAPQSISRITNDNHLEAHETFVSQAGLYLWVAERFPHVCPHAHVIAQQREFATQAIAKFLGLGKPIITTCQDCDQPLPHGTPHRLCDTCFYSDFPDDEEWM